MAASASAIANSICDEHRAICETLINIAAERQATLKLTAKQPMATSVVSVVKRDRIAKRTRESCNADVGTSSTCVIAPDYSIDVENTDCAKFLLLLIAVR